MKIEDQKLVEDLWKQFDPDFKKQRAEHWQDIQKEQAQFGSNLSEESLHCEFADRLQLEVQRRVKEELGDKILMKLSEPSRFEVLYVKTLIRLGSEVKRAMAPEFQKVLDEKGLGESGMGAKYDVEMDIRDTETDLRTEIESKFKLEMLYWSALDEKRFEDAKAFLTAVEVARSNASSELQIEALNWRLNLALEVKDTAMFMTALKKAIGLSEQVEFQKFKSSLEDGVYRLLTQTFLKGLSVAPSDFGLEQARKSGKTTQEYFDEQARLFVRGAVLEIVSRLCVNPESDFLGVARIVLEEKRRTFLSVNPCLKDICAG